MGGISGEHLDWNLLRTFVAVAETGSLAGASRALKLAHPTVARHVQQLEAELKLTLFERSGQGLKITEAGSRLSEVAARLRRSVQAFEAVSEEVRSFPGGRVRITISEMLAELVPELLLELRDDPLGEDRQLEVMVSAQQLNLLDREADLAVRNVRPVQSELVCRRAGALPLGAWASADYVARHGPPTLDNLADHWFVDGATVQHFASAVERLGRRIPGPRIVFRSDCLRTRLRAGELGWGIVGIPDYIAQARAGLVRVFGDLPGPVTAEIWVVARPVVRQHQLLRRTFEQLADGLQRRFGESPGVASLQRSAGPAIRTGVLSAQP